MSQQHSIEGKCTKYNPNEFKSSHKIPRNDLYSEPLRKKVNETEDEKKTKDNAKLNLSAINQTSEENTYERLENLMKSWSETKMKEREDEELNKLEKELEEELNKLEEELNKLEEEKQKKENELKGLKPKEIKLKKKELEEVEKKKSEKKKKVDEMKKKKPGKERKIKEKWIKAKKKENEKYYNYLLLDPVRKEDSERGERRNEDNSFKDFLEMIFYIGRGEGGRCLDHIKEVIELQSTKKDGVSQKKKTEERKIKRIELSLNNPSGVIIVGGFKQSTEYQAECREGSMIAAISLFNLCNIRRSWVNRSLNNDEIYVTDRKMQQLGAYLLFDMYLIFMKRDEKKISPFEPVVVRQLFQDPFYT